MINEKNIWDVISEIEDERNFFNMSDFIVDEFMISRYLSDSGSVPSCGTAACIGGHIGKLMGVDSRSTPDAELGEFLGVDITSAHQLFYPAPCEFYREEITREQAIETLLNLIQTGKVKWPFDEFGMEDEE